MKKYILFFLIPLLYHSGIAASEIKEVEMRIEIGKAHITNSTKAFITFRTGDHKDYFEIEQPLNIGFSIGSNAIKTQFLPLDPEQNALLINYKELVGKWFDIEFGGLCVGLCGELDLNMYVFDSYGDVIVKHERIMVKAHGIITTGLKIRGKLCKRTGGPLEK